MNKKYPGCRFGWFFIFFCVFVLGFHRVSGQKADNGYKLKTVVLDAGHGGKDPGSLGKITTEKEIALAIVLKTGYYIEKEFPEVKVVYTRKKDEFIPLHQRADIANNNKADLFISVHVNGSTNNVVTGTETLLIGLHRAGENFEVAKKENSVILLEDDYTTRYEGFDPNSPESYQMFSLMQEKYFERSLNFGALVQNQFRERAMRKDRGLSRQGLLVLAQTAMPGVLIETGFITNPEEEKYLMTESGQDYIASAIFRAFRDYKDIVETRTLLTASLGNEPVLYRDTALDNTVVTEVTTADVIEEKITPVIEFKVQIAASAKRFSAGSNVFKGMKDVSEFRVGNLYKYAVGSSKSFQDIIVYSRQIKELFPDAFVIAVKDANIIPLDQALKETTR